MYNQLAGTDANTVKLKVYFPKCLRKPKLIPNSSQNTMLHYLTN